MEKSFVIAEQIAHGPYNKMPEAMAAHYRARYDEGMNNEISLEQFMADRESEWQYDQHGEAVLDALEEGRIDAKQATHMIEVVLRPWWIGHRHAHEQEQ